MSYFAAALARRGAEWSGEEIQLDVEDFDEVVDELRQVASDADTLLLFVEEDDEWFGILRIDGDNDPRVFLSDGRVVETSMLGRLFGEAAVAPVSGDADDDEEEDEDEEDDDTAQIAGDPVGDADVLADLGTPASRLLALCAEEGQLPGDIISALCESAGCLDTIESLREG